jgi:hypothetical protein
MSNLAKNVKKTSLSLETLDCSMLGTLVSWNILAFVVAKDMKNVKRKMIFEGDL